MKEEDDATELGNEFHKDIDLRTRELTVCAKPAGEVSDSEYCV